MRENFYESGSLFAVKTAPVFLFVSFVGIFLFDDFKAKTVHTCVYFTHLYVLLSHFECHVLLSLFKRHLN